MTNQELKESLEYDVQGIEESLESLKIREADVALPMTSVKELKKKIDTSWEEKPTQAGFDALLEKMTTLRDAIEGGIVFPLFDRDSDLSRDELEDDVTESLRLADKMVETLTANYFSGAKVSG